MDNCVCRKCSWEGVNIFEYGMRPCCPKCRGDITEYKHWMNFKGKLPVKEGTSQPLVEPESKVIDHRFVSFENYKEAVEEHEGVDFGSEWERLEKKYEKERGLFLLAEREFYAAIRKKKIETNM